MNFYPATAIAAIFVTLQLATSLHGAGFTTGKITAEQAETYNADPSFYKKGTLVHDILIATSDKVPDLVHQETAYQFDKLLSSIRPDVAKRIREQKVLCVLVGVNELTSDLPQFKSNLKGKELDFYNWRQRGFLTRKKGRPVVLFAEEDVLEYEGGMQIESILIHEFGHVIHLTGFDKALNDRLDDAFQRARAKGIWNDGRAAQRFRRVTSKTPVSLLDELVKAFPQQPRHLLRKALDGGDILVNGQRANAKVKVTLRDKVLIFFGGPKECYAHKNRAEYWAEGVQCWYNTNRTMDHDHNHIHTREGLKAYDPQLAALCKDVLGDGDWRFVSPRLRAGKDHLKDFDPADSPVAEDLPHIKEAALDYYDKYWKDYWKRLAGKYALLPRLQAEGVAALAAAAIRQGNGVRGAVIFPKQQLGCAKCHNSNDQAIGPNLNQLPRDATAEYLVEAILDPSKVIKKGYAAATLITQSGETHQGRVIDPKAAEVIVVDPNTGKAQTFKQDEIDEFITSEVSIMPAGLVEELNSRQDFLDLVRYLIDLRDAPRQAETTPHETGGAKLQGRLAGLHLLDQYKCMACHQADLPAVAAPAYQAPDLTWGDGRINPQYIKKFLTDPHQVKPGARMPNVLSQLDSKDRSQAAIALAAYITSKFEEPFTHQQPEEKAIARGQELFHRVGCVACHSPRDKQGAEKPLEDSAAMGDLSGKYNLKGLVSFLKDPHAARPGGRMPDLKLTHWEATDIASFLLQKSVATPAGTAVQEPLVTTVAAGKKYFQQLGCNACHKLENQPAAELHGLTADKLDGGCLSSTAGKWPVYKLKDTETKAIREALSAGAEPLEPAQQISLSLTTFRCTSCHQRGELGGVSAERDGYFHTTNENLGPQGRIPPSLTGIGAKLKPDWLRSVLTTGKGVRPYVLTRMPVFGAANVVHLPPLFEQVDKAPDVVFAEVKDQKAMRDAGHKLAGSDGLNCVACHTFQQKPGQTMSALDLTVMSDRLNHAWFYRYMQAPGQFNQNTVMPAFWPAGKAMRKDILAGDATAQIEALWQYLLDGRQARTPRGLTREPIELLATDEAVMLRRSYPGIGKRGIGVGYPQKINIAFDAQQLRLATIWKGRFAETSGVWRGQGHGTVRPLGTDVLQLAAGPELDNPSSPWKPDAGRPANRQFQGYDLDKQQRPIFRYTYSGIAVTDYITDIKDAGTGDVFLRRRLTFKAKDAPPEVTFRIASGKEIAAISGQEFVIDKKLRIRFQGPQKAMIQTTTGGKTLVVPLQASPQETQITIEYRW